MYARRTSLRHTNDTSSSNASDGEIEPGYVQVRFDRKT